MVHKVLVFAVAVAGMFLASGCGKNRPMEKAVCYDPHFDITTKHVRSDDECVARRTDSRTTASKQTASEAD